MNSQPIEQTKEGIKQMLQEQAERRFGKQFSDSECKKAFSFFEDHLCLALKVKRQRVVCKKELWELFDVIVSIDEYAKAVEFALSQFSKE